MQLPGSVFKRSCFTAAPCWSSLVSLPLLPRLSFPRLHLQMVSVAAPAPSCPCTAVLWHWPRSAQRRQLPVPAKIKTSQRRTEWFQAEGEPSGAEYETRATESLFLHLVVHTHTHSGGWGGSGVCGGWWLGVGSAVIKVTPFLSLSCKRLNLVLCVSRSLKVNFSYQIS